MSSIEALSPLDLRTRSRWSRYVGDSLLTLGSISLLTSVISLFRLYQLIPDCVLLYLLVILTLASTRGLNAALQASFLAFFLYDFLYVPPLYNVVITKFEDIIALVVFLITAITTGHLASALRKRADDASRREQETRILYDILRATNREEDMEHQLTIFTRAVIELFSSWGMCACSLFLSAVEDIPGAGQGIVRVGDETVLSHIEKKAIALVITQSCVIDVCDDVLVLHEIFEKELQERTLLDLQEKSLTYFTRFVPLKTEQRVVGVLRFCIKRPANASLPGYDLGIVHEHPTSHEVFFFTLLEQAIAIIERDRLQRESVHNRVLQQTDALRAALLSSVSHDLRTPLTTIKSAASSLRQKEMHSDEETREHFASAIECESDRLNRLVENLLDMSRIEGGALAPRKVWYPLEEILYTVVERLSDMLRGREIHIALPAGIPAVEIDYMQIGQVVTNLIENALRYTPAGSPIDITVMVQESYVQVSVADRGPGVLTAERERIFDKFYRVHREPHAADHNRGSGLGLAVSRGFVEAHDGKIWVEDREGGGAIFCFTLPKGRPEGEEA